VKPTTLQQCVLKYPAQTLHRIVDELAKIGHKDLFRIVVFLGKEEIFSSGKQLEQNLLDQASG
jgi:hypothetical protein